MQFDNKIFWINFREGSCGSFISLIISQLLWPESSQVEDFPKDAMADGSLDRLIRECRVINGWTSYTEHPVFGGRRVISKFLDQDSIVNLPYDEPELIITSHCPLDFKKSRYKFPNVKHLVITVSERMISRLYANFYYKVSGHIDERIPVNQLQELVKHQTKLYQQQQVDNFVDLQLLWRPETRYDSETENLMWRVDLWRIIHDSEQLLLELAQWVDRPVNDIARATWANYLHRQHELLPWIKDR